MKDIRPSKAGQKYTVPYSKEVLTVFAFFGDDGKEYKSLSECLSSSPSKSYVVKNAEYRGGDELRFCTLKTTQP